MIDIPPDRISEEQLYSLVESFVLREGTDYGSREFSLEEKTRQVIQQIKRGDILITYDPLTETFNLMTKTAWMQCRS